VFVLFFNTLTSLSSSTCFQTNVARLNEYKAKLVLFPKKKLAKPGKGEASVAEQSAATQFVGTVMPVAKAAPVVETMKVTAEMKAFMAHSELRKAFTEKRMLGKRIKAVADRKKAEEEKKK